jgi:hypothetical protein
VIAVAIAPARRVLVWRPEAWLYGLAAFAGVALVLAAPDGAGHVHHHHAAMARDMGMPARSLVADWQHWGVMVLAMMLPIVAPYARRVAMRSVWQRRHRAMACFVLGYLGVWFAVGAVVVAAVAALGAPAVALPVVLLAAAGWQVSAPRRRVMRRCGSLRPCAGDRDCAEAGVRLGARCAFTCGPVMAAMAVSHGLLLMSALFCVLLSERARGPNPGRRAGRPLEACCLAGFAAVAALAAL